MKIQPLKIGTKTAKVPVIQGGMGVGISLGNLAGAVAKEGGIGTVSYTHLSNRCKACIKRSNSCDQL